MSLANLIVQGGSAYLMTDSGWYNKDGTVARLLSKVLGFPSLNLAVTLTGGAHDVLAGIWQEMAHFEQRHGAITGADVVASFAEIFASACMVQGVPRKGRENASVARLAWFDPARGRAFGFIIANIVDDLEGLRPWELVTVHNVLGDADPDAPLGVPLDIRDPAQFDVRRDGRLLVAAQRAKPWSLPGYPLAHYVGGAVHLTTVDAAGVRIETLCEWPDKVGERVRPDLAAA